MLEKIAEFRTMLQKPAEARSMKEKLTVAAGLKGVEQASMVVTRLVATLVLTRLLAPETYGVFVVVITLQVITTMLTDFGPRTLILSMRAEEQVDDRFLNTCWTLQVIRGALLFVLYLLLGLGIAALQAAGGIAPESAYAAPDLPAAFAVLGFAVVLRGFETMKQFLHERELRLVRLSIIRIGFAVVSPLFMILFALVTPTVWCMVLAMIAAQACKTLALWAMLDGPRMQFMIDRRHWQEILSHLRWILSASGLVAMGREADSFVLGFYLPAPVLGVYFIAKQIVSLPMTFVLDLSASMGLQVFNRLLAYDDKAAMRRDYYRFRMPIDAACYFLAGGFMVAGPAIVALLYDPRYGDAGPIIQILALALPTIGVTLAGAGFAAQRRFYVLTLVTFLDLVLLLTGLFVALAVLENAWVAFFAVALFRLPSTAVLLWLARREGWVALLREFRMAPLILVGAAAGWVGAAAVTYLGFN
ncbi:MAG: oligosaccharide flippase family protein [Pseudomonadota bacterium]